MKNILFFISLYIISLTSYAQSADEKVAEAINSGDFFLLDERYSSLKEEMQSPMLKTFSEALLNAVLNRPQQAVEYIDLLVANHQDEIGFDNVKNMLGWQNGILFRMGEYCNVSERANSFLTQVAPHLDSATVSGLTLGYKYYKSMCGEKKSELIRPDEDCVIPLYIEPIEIKGFRKGHLPYVPITINGKEERFIFDTGCPGGLFLSEEYANKFGVRTTLDSLIVNGVGGSGWGKMGILDSIIVGNMTFRNLTVTIVPPNNTVDTIIKINAVLGSDIMKYAGEVQIYPKEKKIVFPKDKTPLPATGRNMIMNSGDAFFVKVYSSKEQLMMLLDTGDSSASLYPAYYQRHKELVERNGKKESSLSGGFGGIIENDIYVIPSFPLKVGKKEFVMKDINVGVDFNPHSSRGEDGSLGMAFINLFDKVTISFDQMFVEVE